jgi:hypothetical protein
MITTEASTSECILPDARESGVPPGATSTQNDHPESVHVDTQQTTRIGEVVLGHLTGFDDKGVPLVEFPLNGTGEPLRARMTTRLSESDVGREVALLFELDDPHKPIVVGAIWRPRGAAEQTADPFEAARHPSAHDDRHQITFSADKAIVLRCGEASITLTKAGKILIRGKYLLSRSTGVNRIKGGAVQIN